jgi:hypothetical protein
MRKIVFLVVFLLLVIFAGWFYWKYYFTYSEGNRTGLLQKFSHKGNLFKTYEGELVLSSLTNNGVSTMSAEKFYFSVDDKTVADKMAGLEGQKVIVHYQEKKAALSWRGDSPYIVDSVSVVKQ